MTIDSADDGSAIGHGTRYTLPRIRRDAFYPKGPLSSSTDDGTAHDSELARESHLHSAFSEATWDEAFELIARSVGEIRSRYGSNALAGLAGTACSNEEAYLFQKLIRAGFGTNNVDHLARSRHAPFERVLLETLGFRAATTSHADLAQSSVMLALGDDDLESNPAVQHQIDAALARGVPLIVVTSEAGPLSRRATHSVVLRPGSEVAFFNGMMNLLIGDGAIDAEFLEHRTEGFEPLRDLVLSDYSPERVAQMCGISAGEITAVADLLATTARDRRDQPRGALFVLWQPGMLSHDAAADALRCLVSLLLLTGNLGRPGTGLVPLRSADNLQGLIDAGVTPAHFPDAQPVDLELYRVWFEQAWGVPLDPFPGLAAREILLCAASYDIRGLYLLREDPLASPWTTGNALEIRPQRLQRGLAGLDLLVVQDGVASEVAELADVILPASIPFEEIGTRTTIDRRVVLPQPATSSKDEGSVVSVLCEILRRLGVPVYSANFAGNPTASEVFDEFVSLTASHEGLSHENLGLAGRYWPTSLLAPSADSARLFGDRFPTPTGRGKILACPYQPTQE